MTPPQRVVDFIVDYLNADGTEHIFGVGGANIEDLYDAIHNHSNLTGVLAKHEFSAATMADGYSRAGCALGVVVATSGGGSLNLLPGLGESRASRVPVLAIIGQPPMFLDGRGSFQDTSGSNGSIDAEAVFGAVAVHCTRITQPGDIVTALPAAIAAARAGGPAVLLIPKDIQQAVIPATAFSVAPAASSRAGTRPEDTAPNVDPRMLAHALASGPVTIIAGDQVARDDARDELRRLRESVNALVVTVPDAKDAHAGAPVTGVMGHLGVAEAIDASAVCLLVGTRLPGTASAGLEASLARVPTVSIGNVRPFPDCVHFHSDDLRVTLAGLTRLLDETSRSHPDAGIEVPTELTPPQHDGPGIRYRDALTALDRVLPDDVDIVVDAGNTGASAIHYLPVRPDGRFVVALGMGGMGYGFGAGIGMAFARGHRVVIIAGDGSFFMHGMEIHTAIQYHLPVTFVLFNNDAHGMCVTREQLYYGGDYSYNRFDPSALGVGLAAMFPGLHSVDIDAIADLPDSLATALNQSGPSVVSIRCSADEIPPFAPFLGFSTVKDARPEPISTAPAKETDPDVAARA